MRGGRADGADDSFAHPGNDRLFGGPADDLPQVRPHRYPGLDLQLDSVLGHAVERFSAAAADGTVDHLGIDAGLDGFEHVSSGQVDGGRQLEVEVQLGLVCSHQGTHHQGDVSAGQVVGFQVLGGEAIIAQPGLHRHDLAADNDRRADLADGHEDQVEHADSGPREFGLEPKPEIPGEDRQDDQCENHADDRGDHQPGSQVFELGQQCHGLLLRDVDRKVDVFPSSPAGGLFLLSLV